MTDRRTDILDTAITVLAGHGMRGLTHRAVDQAAGIPTGSTSYYFRTRASLVSGVVARMLELDVAELTATAPAGARGLAPQSIPAEVLPDLLAEAGVQLATSQRERTIARYELSLVATRSEPLRAELAAGGNAIRRVGAATLAAAGVPDPERAAEDVAAIIDGMLFTALLRGPDDPAELAAQLRPALRRVLASYLVSARRTMDTSG